MDEFSNQVVSRGDFDPLQAAVGDAVMLYPHPGESLHDLAVRMRGVAAKYRASHGLSFIADASSAYQVRFKRIRDGWHGRLSEWLSLEPGEFVMMEPYIASEEEYDRYVGLADFFRKRWGLEFSVDALDETGELWVQRHL